MIQTFGDVETNVVKCPTQMRLSLKKARDDVSLPNSKTDKVSSLSDA